MSEPLDPLERELATRLQALALGEAAPRDLVDRAAARAGELAHRRRVHTRGIGATVVALGVAAVWVLSLSTPGPARGPGLETAGRPLATSSTVAVGGGSSPLSAKAPAGSRSAAARGHGGSSPGATGASGALGETTAAGADPTSADGVAPVAADGTGGDDGSDATTTTLMSAARLAPASTDVAPEGRCAEVTGSPSTWGSLYTPTVKDHPATVRVCVDDVTPAVGQVVHVTVVGDDPDDQFSDSGRSAGCARWGIAWGDDRPTAMARCDDGVTVPPPGAAPPPAGAAGHVEGSASHAYAGTGTFTLTGTVASGPDAPGTDPYASTAAASLQITVHA